MHGRFACTEVGGAGTHRATCCRNVLSAVSCPLLNIIPHNLPLSFCRDSYDYVEWKKIIPKKRNVKSSAGQKMPRAAQLLGKNRFFLFCPRLHNPLRHHGVGHLQKSRDIRSRNIVALFAIFRCRSVHIVIDVYHDIF